MSKRIPWRSVDPVTLDEYFWPVNPSSDAGSFDVTKTVKYAAALSTYKSSGGDLRVNDTVLATSPDSQPVISYDGTVYTKEQYDDFVAWMNKPYPWKLRDDLGREILFYVESYSINRVRSTKFRFKHSYSFTGLILEELS
ncbi:hypothetical protein EKI60_05990 [Candidatus Saccharibacteria bacterium]|nr:MAG: hypothetical protein EKI60_05990 [Candidatus Saccharibacteria bacterium]